MVNLALLYSFCVISFVSPIGGIALVLVLNCSLFHLYQYASVQLPLGYVEPTEAIIAMILLRLAWNHAVRRGFRNRRRLTVSELRTRTVLVSAIVPYVAWQTLCAARGAFIWYGTPDFNFALRFVLRDILPWSLVFVVWVMRGRRGTILQIALAVALATSLAHIAVQFSGNRSLMTLAYWHDLPEDALVRRVLNADYVRGMPQGSLLILFCLVYCFCNYLIGRVKRPRVNYALMAVFSFALFLCVVRSFMFSVLVGCVIALFLAFLRLPVLKNRVALRFLSGVAALCFVIIPYCVLNPDFMDFWVTRIQDLVTTADTKIFSEENAGRGQVNQAAMAAIKDNLFLGCGIPYYPEEYNPRDRRPGDIHPVLLPGVVGGLAGIFLMLRLEWVLFWGIWRTTYPDRSRFQAMLPYLTIVALSALFINLCGAGGTMSGFNTLTMVLFVGLMAAESASDFHEVVV